MVWFNYLLCLFTITFAADYEIRRFIALNVLLDSFAQTVDFDLFLAQFPITTLATVTTFETPNE